MTATGVAAGGVMGTRRLRREDPALLTGEAKFVADLVVPGAVHVALVRSTVAHARIVSIDASPARTMPGVLDVVTGADLAAEWTGPLPCAWPVTADMKSPMHLPLAVAKVCHVGDGVAAVVAETEYAARDAAEAVLVEYEPLPAVVDLEDARSDRVVIHEELGTNTSYVWELVPDAAAVERAFDEAAHTVE